MSIVFRARALLAVLLVAPGCTVVREVPRSDYGTAAERRNVRVLTRDNFEYEFDFARVAGDSLHGFRRVESPSPIDEYSATHLALTDIERLSTRRVDWLRTGALGAAAIGSVIAVGLRDDDPGSPPAPSTPPRVP